MNNESSKIKEYIKIKDNNMISNYLKDYFKKERISQYDIERKTGIKQGKISLIFNGKRKLTADELIRISIIYDLDLNKIKKSFSR